MTSVTNHDTAPPASEGARKLHEHLVTLLDGKRPVADRARAMDGVLTIVGGPDEFAALLLYLAARQRAKETKPGKVAH